MSVYIPWLSPSHRPVFLINSRLGLFTAAPSRSGLFTLTITGHPFSRSYGVILPSSLTRVRSNTLGYSPRPPVSVCGTVSVRLKLRSCFSATSLGGLRGLRLVPRLGVRAARICLGHLLHAFNGYSNSRPRCTVASLHRIIHRFRNINLIPISFAIRYTLGAD